MDQPTYEQWWELHLRVSRGEALSEQERLGYESGLHQLHNQETLTDDLSAIRRMRAAVVELGARCDQLRDRRQQLQGKIARLEAALSGETRRTLGIKD